MRYKVRKRGPIQKILFSVAVVSYVAAIACGAAALYLGAGSGDPVAAALMASVVFFAGVGIVLQVIANTDLPNLKIGD